jgi:hypothetical protein
MSFNSRIVKSTSQGAKTAFTAPLAAFGGSLIALNGITAGSTASSAGLVLPLSNPTFQIEWESLWALVETDLTTSTITATSKWQYSPDGTNWLDVLGLNAAANVTKAAAGTGSLITTQYAHAFAGMNPAAQAVRLAIQVGVATGAAGDNATVSYFFVKRWQGG